MTRTLQICYRRSGGIAGVEVGVDVDGDHLTAEHVATARDLLAKPPVPRTLGGAVSRPDQFSHRLKVSDGRTSRIFRWTDTEIPEAARALLSTLREQSRPLG